MISCGNFPQVENIFASFRLAILYLRDLLLTMREYINFTSFSIAARGSIAWSDLIENSPRLLGYSRMQFAEF